MKEIHRDLLLSNFLKRLKQKQMAAIFLNNQKKASKYLMMIHSIESEMRATN